MFRNSLFCIALLALAALLLPTTAAAQKKIKIISFEQAEFDPDARTNFPRRDLNDDLCAIVKVQKNDPGFRFDVGSIGVTYVDFSHTGETWVYLPPRTRKMSIKHNDFGNSDEYQFPSPLEQGKVYIMEIVTEGVSGGRFIEDVKETGRYVEFIVTPTNATLELNGEILPLDNGYATKFMGYGAYEYRVSRPNYHSTAGKLVVAQGSSENIRQRITLRPAFGMLEVKSTAATQGAAIYLDNGKVGELPYTNNEVRSGQHSVRVAMPMYKTFEQTVTIEDGQTLTLTPELVPNFAEPTLTVDADADIYVNGQKKGRRTWRGPLEVGSYKVECRQENHEPVSQTVVIGSNQDSRTITLEKPVPIFGTLRITSSPAQAELFIDGDHVGTTPYYSPRTIIGRHQVSVRKEGYGNTTDEFTLERDQVFEKTYQLDNIVEVVLTTTPDSANIYIDGTLRGVSPVRTQLKAGQHSLRISKADYYGEEREVNFDGSNPTVHVKLNPNFSVVNIYTKPDRHASLYIDGQTKSVSLPGSVRLKHGKHQLRVSSWPRYKGERSVRVDGMTKNIQIGISRNLIDKNCFYIEPMYKYSSDGLSGFGGSMGFFAGNFNMEGSFFMPLGFDETEIYYYNANNEAIGYSKVKPKYEFGGKIGIGIRLGKRMRVTPQVGARYIMVDGDPSVSGMGTTFGLGSLRMSYVLCNGIALTVVPEYAFPIIESDGYKAIKETITDMKKWNDGINVLAGISFFL